ncbi:hypothetical protein [Nocardia arizonensis]|uniref:hypothetical protein n=1 Tax=Nocardia arizonensis TaxID=1141647 RepID=UPI0006D0259F|nr:hypothetical protein [Nocardia arizonensis]
MTLTRNEWLGIRAALQQWMSEMPDEPALGFLSGERILTRRELLTAADNSANEDGVAFVGLLEHAVRRDGIESVIDRLARGAR